MNGPFLLGGPETYRVIPQRGVRQYVYPQGCIHNAIWDSNAGPDGKLWYGLATELSTSGYVRLCSYDYHTQQVTEHFRVEDVILPQDRQIRASKFHSSISFLPDGRLIMTTHTTDKSPRHPAWMPIAYYHHLWEGFAGGHILIYDPKSGKAENLGCPVPHESIYGACYEPDTGSLFFTGWIRGHLYCFRLKEKQVLDLGKVSENNAFRLVRGADGKIYGSSRSGHLYRVAPRTLAIEDLDYQFRHETYDHHTRYNELSIARTGPDGRLYMAVMYGRSFLAFDTKRGTMEDLGPYLPAERYSPFENRNGVFGMDFDRNGVLWYVVTSLNNYEENLEFGIPAGLFRWDILRGGTPEFMGVAGTQARACAWNSEVVCTKDNILYITGSNHALDGPDLLGIDLNTFDVSRPCSGPVTQDAYFDPENAHYRRCAEKIQAHDAILAANPADVQLSPAFAPVLLWRALAPKAIAQSAVKHLFWQGEALCGVCGEQTAYAFRIEQGKLSSLRPLCELSEAERAAYAKKQPEAPDFPLPYKPGRQYLARASAQAAMADGRLLIGTQDGLLALAGKDGVFSLGAPAPNGPVHALCAVPDGSCAYGVCGDELDLPTLFRFDLRQGLQALGYMSYGGGMDIDSLCFLTYVTTCALSPDGRYLAVGADERLGTVLVYRLPD